MRNFRCYQQAVILYKRAKKVKLNYSIKDQLLRASSSIVLNLAEGNDRRTQKDRYRFFNMALTSLREVQAIIDIEGLNHLHSQADILGAHIYRLLHPKPSHSTD